MTKKWNTLLAGLCCLGMSLASTASLKGEEYNIERTLGDGAQLKTMAFDALAFLTGNLGGQSFLPPGKVADYSGFQYLRDNDPTGLGHNTDFVTIIAFNMLHLLSDEQVNLLVESAKTEVALINSYAYKRFPLMKAFRRQLDGDIPEGTDGLDKDAVLQYSSDIYKIDGQISYNRAKLLGSIYRSLSDDQKEQLAALKALNGVGNWDKTLSDPLQELRLDHDVNVAVMTYASEMYSWVNGSVTGDTYFCPERQATYFGSFYLKDWPAMGNPDYTIDEQLTARAGEDFLAVLDSEQYALISNIVTLQKESLYAIVDKREEISTLLRQFMVSDSVSEDDILKLSEEYGQLDGYIVYLYATCFSQVYKSLTDSQKAELTALVDNIGYEDSTGAFLYSAPIDMPEIEDTDFLFGAASENEDDGDDDEGSDGGEEGNDDDNDDEDTGTTTDDHYLAIGSTVSIAASDCGLTEFNDKVKVIATVNGKQKMGRVIEKPSEDNPQTEIQIVWKSKYRLYDKLNYNGTQLSQILISQPIEDLLINNMTVKTASQEIVLTDKFYLAAPVITSIDTIPQTASDEFTVTGKYFGMKCPKIMLEYYQNGDESKPRYKRCKVIKTQSLIYKNAYSKENASCMKIFADDLDSNEIGYSQIKVIYPKLPEKHTPTGYIILNNKSGLASFELKED